MRFDQLFLYLTVVILLNSCGISQSDTEDEGIIVAEVTADLQDYYNAVRTGGLEAGSKFLYQHSNFFWAPPGYTSLISYDSVISTHQSKTDFYSLVSFEWDMLKVIPLSTNLVNYAGLITGVLEDTTGKVTNVRMVESGVLKKEDGVWKFFSGQSSILDNSEPFLGNKMKSNKIKGLTLAITDMKGMINFYSRLFGIEFNEVEMFGSALYSGEWQGMDLLFCPAEIAGNTAQQNRHQFHVLVTDLDRMIELVKKNGGKLLGEIQVEEGIRKIGIHDPDNNSLVLEELL